MSATVTSITVSGATSLVKAGQTVQLKATATFSDGTTQDVTATATWQSSNTGLATVSASGLVTAVGSGTVTITVTFQGKTTTATIPISFSTSTKNTLTATIDGVSFSAVSVLVTSVQPTGIFVVGGVNQFATPFLDLTLSIPGSVGTFPLSPLGSGIDSLVAATLQLDNPGSAMEWLANSALGGSGTITVTSFSSTGASGTFSFTLVPLGSTATGNRSITNGAFNVVFGG